MSCQGPAAPGSGVRGVGGTLLAESVTDLTPELHGAMVACGSHGGYISGRIAVRAGVAAIAFNDAGVGKENAGVEGLGVLARYRIPGLAVSAHESRIGLPMDTLLGRVRHLNTPAAERGCRPGMTVDEAFAVLRSTAVPAPRTASASESESESASFDPSRADRRRLVRSGPVRVYALDSASMVEPGDAEAVVVTGSHGGLPGLDVRRAIRAPTMGAAFNDAGGGKGGAGWSRLPILADREIPAVTVAGWSARIGDGVSTYSTGVISHANSVALDLGIRVGSSCMDFVDRICELSELS